MSDTIKGADEIAFEVKVVAYPDRPGIARVYLGEKLIFDADGPAPVQAQQLAVRVKLPFHIHFPAPELSMALAWKEQ